MKRHNTSKGPKAAGPYSSAVVHGDLVYLSGVVPADPETGAIVTGGIEIEAKRVLDNISLILSELDLTLANVIKATVFLADMNDFAKVNAVYKDAFDACGSDGYPARSCVQVARLPLSVNIEIEVIASTK